MHRASKQLEVVKFSQLNLTKLHLTAKSKANISSFCSHSVLEKLIVTVNCIVQRHALKTTHFINFTNKITQK